MEDLQVQRRYMSPPKIDVKVLSIMPKFIETPILSLPSLPVQSLPVQLISLKFKVQVKCFHLVSRAGNIPSLVRHQLRACPLDTLYCPVSYVEERDDDGLQKFLLLHCEACRAGIIDVKQVVQAIKETWEEINKTVNFWSFGSVLPLTITIKLKNFLTLRDVSESVMVPTSKYAMEALLKKVKVEDVEVDRRNCVICMEEIIERQMNNAMLQMPCLHVFHEDCINKWLAESHYCPICRFVMPTV